MACAKDFSVNYRSMLLLFPITTSTISIVPSNWTSGSINYNAFVNDSLTNDVALTLMGNYYLVITYRTLNPNPNNIYHAIVNYNFTGTPYDRSGIITTGPVTTGSPNCIPTTGTGPVTTNGVPPTTGTGPVTSDRVPATTGIVPLTSNGINNQSEENVSSPYQPKFAYNFCFCSWNRSFPSTSDFSGSSGLQKKACPKAYTGASFSYARCLKACFNNPT